MPAPRYSGLPCRRGTRFPPRGGFTLLELMLVLGILVVVAAVSAPVTMGLWDGHRLLKSGDEVRAIWNRARVEAMRTGQVQVFRHASLTNQYVVEPFQSPDAYLESSSAFADPVQSLNPTEMQTITKGMKFFSASAQIDLRSARVLEQLQDQGQAVGALSDPIFFYPDGTASTARLILANDEDQFVMIELRGLTGLAAVSGLMSFEELPQ